MKTRIVHNGHMYRVEVLRHRRFLWWRWERWRPLYRLCYPPYMTEDIVAEFRSLEEAQKARDAFLNEHVAPGRWEVVREDGE